MKAAVEESMENLVRSEKGFLLNALLTPPSSAYKMGVKLRNWAYDRALFRMKRAPLPVVSIGNVVAGGAGKTSLTYMMAKELLPLGKVAILSSGYRSISGNREPQVVSMGRGPEISWEVAGDEAWLLAELLPEAIVISGRNRFQSAELAWLLGAKIALLDDGMQHRELFRDFEVAVIDGEDPMGGGHFLPKGMLRDDPRRLNEADWVVVVGGSTPLPVLDGKKWVRVRRKVKEIQFGNGKSEASLKGKKVGIFCGIGNPKSFVRTVEEEGATITATRLLADHRGMDKETLSQFAKEVKEKNGEFLLCTEKDWVKIAPSIRKVKEPLPLAHVKSEFEIVENGECWKWAAEQIKNRLVL